jgi:hypothetical protein
VGNDHIAHPHALHVKDGALAYEYNLNLFEIARTDVKAKDGSSPDAACRRGFAESRKCLRIALFSSATSCA